MSEDLVVNPHLQCLLFSDDDSRLELTAPQPGYGLRTITIDRASDQDLFEVFADLSKTKFDFLDPALDLNENERRFLVEHGILVQASQTFERPFFECKLADVVGVEISAGTFIVNPTFRYKPLDLKSFANALQTNLSPYNASAWIRSQTSGLEVGFWLSPVEAEVLSQVRAGTPVASGMNPELLGRLLAAGVVISPESFHGEADHCAETFKRTHEEFISNKYSVMREMLPPVQMAAMRRYYRAYVERGFMPFGDSQVKNRFRQHNEPFASFLHGQLTGLMSKVVGREVKPSYVYAASYKDGAELLPHTDREQCEFSISFQVDYEPEQPGQVSPWPIFVEPLPEDAELGQGGLHFSWEEFGSNKNGRANTPLHLASGDGLIYKGRELIHYRYQLPPGHRSTSLFFHYVAADFSGSLN